MAKKTLEQLIDQTRNEHQPKNIIAFLGNVSTGKTVVSALVKYTLTRLWIPRSNGRWDAMVSSGSEEINEILRKMKKGEFPSATPGENYPELGIDIFRMEGPPDRFNLKLHDIPGENYSDLLTDQSYSNIGDRLKHILNGRGAYLAYAKKYAIMIDCGKKGEWDTDIEKVALMISKIREIKQIIHNFGAYEKIRNPVAIVFTKADRLSEEDKTKSAEELAREYHELYSSLRANHDLKLVKFFKVSVSSRIETDEDVTKRLKKIKEEISKKHEMRRKSWDEQIKTAVKEAENKARATAEGKNLAKEEVPKIVKRAALQTKSEYEKQFNEKYPQQGISAEDGKKKWKIDIPLKYTDLEYINFISWILDTNNET